ncbi:hypothetical protein CAAN1_34S00210 [[Candida] anglica]|uniref:Transcriptional regulator n=1 Tax=[Candida] anglica TaxID=148631 RepID=A0ABP0EBQ8_9ASCO
MYIPKKYLEEDWEFQEKIIKEYPLATVITTGPEGIQANHIPFFLHIDESTGKKYLHAHAAKKNPQIPALTEGKEVLIIFKSTDSYIAPEYYPGKQIDHKRVPTWDFAAVHIYGKSKIIDDAQWVRKQLDNFTHQNEKSRENPWKVSDAPEKYVTLLQKAICGVEIEIERIECKYKFEQKEIKQDIDGVTEGLAKDGIHEMSKLVKDTNARWDKK